MASEVQIRYFGNTWYSWNQSRIIGHGTYSNVYQGTDISTNKPVAIKICRLTIGKLTRAYFIREVENLNNTSSPYVVKVIYYNVGQDSATLILEYCAGPTLRDFLNKNTLSVQCCLKWMDQLLQGLNCAWTQGIVHRDIKGSNIMLTEDSPLADLKLIDFGMSKVLEAENTMQVGSPKYMAPEVAQKSQYNQKADIWSLGVLFYEMSVGNWPYLEVTPTQEELNALIQAAPDGLQQLLGGMTAINPESRFDHVSLVNYFTHWKGQITDTFILPKTELLSFKTEKSYVLDRNQSRVLGSGMYSQVYQGTDLLTNKPVAIKICKLTLDKLTRAYFIREVENLSKTSSPYVVKVIYFNIGQDSATLISEYCAGPNLRDFLNKNTLSVQCCLKWMDQLLQGLNCAWTQGIVHRDIKGSNIMLTENSPSADLKLIDFGMSKILEAENTMQVGSPKYMAPEVAQKSQYNQKADIWSLGVLFYEMSVGNWPYLEVTPTQEELNALIQAAPDGLQELLGGMTAINPESRFDHVNLVNYFAHWKWQITDTFILTKNVLLSFETGRSYVLDRSSLIDPGTNSEGYLAIEQSTNNLVAVRICQLADVAIEHQHIEEDIFKLQKAESRYVTKVLDFKIDTRTVIAVFEHVAGPTMQQILNANGPLSPEYYWRWIDQLLQGLNSTWTQDIVYRDINGTSIMLTENSPSADLKITGLGLSKVFDIRVQNGTRKYLAPEVIQGKVYDQRADIWSLGVLIYEMSVGDWPEDEATLSQDQVNALIQSVPDSLQFLLGSMLVVDPDFRLTPVSLLQCFQYIKYDFHEKIGETGRSEVWRATNRTTNTEIAIKSYSLHEEDKTISREPKCQETVTSSYTVHCYEHFVVERRLYLVMELCRGGTLASFLTQSGALHEGLAWDWMLQLAQGLAHFSTLQVIHRDIKTDNIFLTDHTYSARLKIGDFGISRLISNTDMTKGIGTPSYMAPETLRCDRYSSKIDVWGMGVVFYEIVSGSFPYEHKSRKDIKKSQKQIKELPAFVSGTCQDLIKRMLTFDPINRLHPAHVVEHQFFQRKPLSYAEELMHKRSLLVTMSDSRYVLLASFYNNAIRLIQSHVKLAVKMERGNNITCSYLSLSLSKFCIQKLCSVLPGFKFQKEVKVALDALVQVIETDINFKAIRSHKDLAQWPRSDLCTLIFEHCRNCLHGRQWMEKHAFRLMKRLCRSRSLLQTPGKDYWQHLTLLQSLYNARLPHS